MINEILHRMDFQLCPVSIDMIEPNLYLGGLAAARNLGVLNKYKITHILTIDTCPLPQMISQLKQFVTKFIQLSDQPKSDLLSYFDETDLFIKDGLSKGAVLVHCYFGVSRSATVVIAHLMKKYKITYHEAFEKVKTRRGIVCPNQGFVTQLNLYQKLGYKTNLCDMNYKVFLLNIAADSVRKVKVLPQIFHNLIQPDPGVQQTHPEPNVYQCGKCRRVVATESNLIYHQVNGEICRKMYFVEPLSWMNCTQNVEGKLLCIKCNAKLGSFNWAMGCKCPCGVNVAPGFYIIPSKVDFSNVIKNIEITV